MFRGKLLRHRRIPGLGSAAFVARRQILLTSLGESILGVLSFRRRRQVGDVVELAELARPRWNWAGDLRSQVDRTRKILRKEK